VRPKAIIYFERIICGTLLLGALQNYLGWDRLVALAGATRSNPVGFVILVQALTIALIVTLTLLVSRRRSRIAMWVSILLFVFGLPAVAALAAQGLLFGSGAITMFQTVGQLIAYGLLFMPSARQWMRSDAHSPETSSAQ
jgi:hypothetical protein